MFLQLLTPMNTEKIIAGIREGGDAENRKAAILSLQNEGLPTFREWLIDHAEKLEDCESIFEMALTQLVWHIDKGTIDKKPMLSLQNLCIANWLVSGDSVPRRKYFNELRAKAIRFLIKNKANPSDADDFIQQGMEIFVSHLMNKKFRGASLPDSYLNSICLNIYKSSFRSSPPISSDESEDIKSYDPDLFDDWIKEDRKKLWLMTKIDELKTNCKDILKDWANGVSGKEMMERYQFASESVVFVRVHKCKRNLRTHIFSVAGNDCKKLLFSYYSKKKKEGFHDHFYIDLARENDISETHALIQKIDFCWKKIYADIFRGV